MNRALLILPVLMVACSTAPTRPEAPPVPPGPTPVLIDRYLLESCEKPTPLPGLAEPVFVAWVSDLLSKYKKCYEKNEAHLKLLRNNFPQVQPKE